MRPITGILFFILLVFQGYSQTELRFKSLTINDGLSQSSVTTILQDDLNALWLGTQDGLNRYDGKTFEVFTSDETPGLQSEYIVCSLKDNKGNLWFGTSNGLTCFDIRTETFKTYITNKSASFFILDLVQSKDGKIWMATAESGVYSFDISTEKFKNYPDILPTLKSSSIEILENGDIIISTDKKGVYRWKTNEKTAKKIEVNKKESAPLHVNKLVYNGGNSVYLATNQGVYVYKSETNKIEPWLLKFDQTEGFQNISDIYYHNGLGWLLCTNNNGLYLFDDKEQINHYQEDVFLNYALLFNELNTIFLDNSGVFWVGSKRGLSSFNPTLRGFLSVGPSQNLERGLPSLSVWSFEESNDKKKIYIGTDKAVTIYNKEKRVFSHFERLEGETSHGSGEMTILAIKEVDENRILLGCADGLVNLYLNNGKGTFVRKDLQNHNRIYSITHWKGSKYWLASKDGALLYDISNESIEFFEHNSRKPEETISKGICRMVFKDNNNRVWFATSTGGLNVLSIIDGKPVIRPYEHNYIIKSTTTNYISAMYQEQDGKYWLATSGSGLLYWNEQSKEVTLFDKKTGLPNNVVYGLVEGEPNTLWLSTNKGLSKFDTKTKKTKNYTEIDGLMSNEFNVGAYMKASTGELYFGGIYGYNYFYPKELGEKEQNVDIVFTKFKLEKDWLKLNSEDSPLTKPIFLTKSIDLGYHQRSFTIRFQPSDLSYPELINYKYMLEGSDEGEVLLGESNEIHFSMLSPGAYELKVYARLGDGVWNSEPATIKINVKSPFWFTWWFWTIVVIVSVLGGIIFVRVRIEASRREQVKLEMKIRDRTREIKEQNIKIESQKKKIEEERNKVVAQQKLLQIEKDKSEKLLKNVIPESTAEELKKKGKARARAYKTVSVLFTDFVGFTKISERMSATELVKKLDVYFTKFDEIIVHNNLEKIKTIGDAYMCAGGVPVRNNTNPIDACLAALQIQDYMLQLKNDAIANGQEYWDLRLGINTGEVTAGVIGSERLAYDIWGATVNQAQRMEMLGEPGKVTITGATFKHIEPYFECTFLGKAQTKSRGLIDMYVVERIKPELSENGEGIFPNKRFNQIVNLHLYSSINYYKAERHIMKVLEQGLSKNLHYHSIAHTKDVVKSVERLALLENVTDEGLFLLKSAATYHDAGFVEQYDNNEPVGARLADEILPKYGYTLKHIDRIKELIYVTQIPHQPKDQLEEIICDADLDYLGRDDFHEISDKLKRELIEHGKIKNSKEWDKIQVSFLSQHRYFTKTAIETRSKKKLQNLEEVKERLEKDEYLD